jgi:signal transduction histidine kinase
MGDLLHPFQIRLAKQTFLQVVAVLFLQTLLLAWRAGTARELATTFGLLLVAVAAWLGTDLRSYQRSRGFSLLLGAALLAAPWTSGGLRHPAAFLGLILLHPLALFFGVRAVWWYAAFLICDFLLLIAGEMHGWIVGSAPSSETLLLIMTALVGYMLFFAAVPLVQVRRLLNAASHHLQERRSVDSQLQRLEETLEERVEEREEVLLRRLAQLQALARDNAAELRPGIDGLRSAILAVQDAYVSAPPSRSLARIAEGGKRVETMQKALERFCQVAGQAPHVQAMAREEHEALVRNVWEELQEARSVRMRMELGPLAGCQADPVLLRHVWQNLLSNAAKYSARNPEALVEIFHDAEGFHVRDNGVGFDPHYADALFGLFQRLHPASEFPGTGVGLAIAHRIVEMHHGNLTAQSSPGNGAMFSFTLPERGLCAAAA